jgi:hypothetical protein
MFIPRRLLAPDDAGTELNFRLYPNVVRQPVVDQLWKTVKLGDFFANATSGMTKTNPSKVGRLPPIEA